MGIVSFTVKIEKDKRDLMKKFCKTNGFKMQKFLENAIDHEVRRELRKENLLLSEEQKNYGKKKK